ncbi:MAG: S9 family peptidase [Acidobacteriota bacterium]
MGTRILLTILIALSGLPSAAAQTTTLSQTKPQLQLTDVFQLEYASDPQISPDGAHVVFVRNFMDIMKDRERGNLWIVESDGTDLRPLTTGLQNDFSPRWSPDGRKLLYASATDTGVQIFLRWMDTGQTARLTQLARSPQNLVWSPDGRWIAFTMLVPEKPQPLVSLPAPPEGAEWADPPKLIRKLEYRADGRGYLEDGFVHLFTLSAEGGTPRQVTQGEFHHPGAPVWTPDGKALIISANRHEDWEFEPLNSEIYEVRLDGTIRELTHRNGPDRNPAVSPDGSQIAYVGFDDRLQGYQVTHLYVMSRDGSDSRNLTADFDRDVQNPVWSHDGQGLYFQFDDQGTTKIGYLPTGAGVETVCADVGGLSLGRPYSGGSYSVSPHGEIAYTLSRPDFPAEVAVTRLGQSGERRLTRLNDDLFDQRTLGRVEEIWFDSSFDGRKIQGWVVTPPEFDSSRKYPLLLEIHGGPFADYGSRFAAEMQLYAAAGYVVLYTNPRGSTGYGEEFGNLIHHNYPGQDYDDLMSGVDALLARGYIDPDRLFVTGGSGGGVLSAWIVGKTHRFRAAVVAKPVINWYSFALTSDEYNFFYKYWFSGFPWDVPEEYLKRSPLSLVGNVTTPTMLMTGESDHRTPISESEQFYQALKLRRVDTAMVRIPGASHEITSRPSRLMAKVAYVLGWFEKHDKQE